MKRTLIHNATIVNEGQPTQGSVVIENGRIAEVLTNWKPLSAPCEEVIDATGCYLLPGIIDDHVHFRDPGLTHKADILTESSAAAAGGVTSIMDMPNTNPLTVTLDALNSKFDLLNEKCIVNHSCYFGATNDNYTEFDKLDKSRVCGIKLFMGSSTGNMLVDNCAMQLVKDPKQFDVILTENMFGDILSDEASMITGSIGMLSSASLAEGKFGLYEPSHGSAPDIAGQDIANPIATILSAAMMLRYSFDLDKEADEIEKAVKAVLADGYRTVDIMSDGMKKVGCKEMGQLIIDQIK